MSKVTETASKKRKVVPEPVGGKKRTKVAVPESGKSKKPSSKKEETEVTSISSRNAPEARQTRSATKSAAAKTSKPAAKQVKPSGADDFAGFSDSEDEAQAAVADHTDALLAGFSSDSESDAEQSAAITKIPALPDSSELTTQLAAAAASPDSAPGTIYVGRIPHGFFEPQMREYFSQFGDIARLRLSRNKLTGKSKHYAYVEFESGAVADIVAKTMDKYLMFGHILQVRRLKPEEVHAELYKGANRRFKPMPRNKIEGSQLEKPRGREVWEKRVKREEQRRKSKAQKLSELGYEFDMPEVKQVDAVPKKLENKKDAEANDLETEPVQELLENQTSKDASVVEDSSEVVAETDPSAAEKRKKGRKEKKGSKKARLST